MMTNIKRYWIPVFVILGLGLAGAVYFLMTPSKNTTTMALATPAPAENISQPPPTVPQPTATTHLAPVSPVSPLNSPLKKPSIPNIDEGKIQSMIQSAIILQENGSYDEVISIVGQILDEDPVNFLAYNIRGSAYLATNSHEKALADYSKAVELSPLFPHAHFNRGRVYSILGQYNEAVRDLTRSTQLAPVEFGYRANGNIGLIYHKQGMYNEAIDAFDESIAQNDDEKADVYFFRGETYTAMENYEAAIADYQSAVQRFARYGKAYQSLGYAHYKLGQFDEALIVLEQADAVSEANLVTDLYRLLVFVATDQTDKAQQAVLAAIQSIESLPAGEQEFFVNRALIDLENLSKETPDKAETVEQVINVFSNR